MGNELFLPILFALPLWYCLGIYARSRAQRDKSTLPFVEKYLFRGNRPELAIGSNIGSSFTVAYFLFTIPAAAFHNGSTFIIYFLVSLLLAYVSSYIIWHFGLSKAFADRQRGEYHSFVLISIDRIAARYGDDAAQATAAFVHAYYFFFYLAITAVEIGALTWLLSLMGGSNVAYLEVIWLVLAVCLSYLLLGGFRGALLTDAFQLLMIYGFAVLVVAYWAGAVWPAPTSGVAFGEGLGTLLGWLGARLKENYQGLTVVGTAGPTVVVITIIAMTLCSVAWILSAPDFWIRTYGTIDKGKGKVLVFSGLGVSLTVGLMTMVALFFRSVATGSVKIDGFEMAASFDKIYLVGTDIVQGILRVDSPVFAPLFVLCLFAVSLTTIDTYVMTLVQINGEGTDKTRTWRCGIKAAMRKTGPRVLIVCFLVLTGVLGLLISRDLELMVHIAVIFGFSPILVWPVFLLACARSGRSSKMRKTLQKWCGDASKFRMEFFKVYYPVVVIVSVAALVVLYAELSYLLQGPGLVFPSCCYFTGIVLAAVLSGIWAAFRSRRYGGKHGVKAAGEESSP